MQKVNNYVWVNFIETLNNNQWFNYVI
jgi:hypothetical protein